MAHGCNKLRYFVGKGLKSLSDGAMISLAQYCKNLEHVSAHTCPVSFYYINNYTITPRWIIVQISNFKVVGSCHSITHSFYQSFELRVMIIILKQTYSTSGIVTLNTFIFRCMLHQNIGMIM